MIYTKKQDKEQIKTAFSMFLIEHGFNLMSFCKGFDLNYHNTYMRINKYNIPEDWINSMIWKVDKSRSLQKLNTKFVISKKY